MPRGAAAAVGAAWRGEPGATGQVAVVGAGKIGLPLAAQFASAGWLVDACDVDPAVVETINAGRPHFAEEPDLAEKVAAARTAGRLRATLDTSGAVGDADVVAVIVPVMLLDDRTPDYAAIDAATEAVGRGLRGAAERGAPTLVVFETTVPVGTTRRRLGTILEATSGLGAGDPERGFLLAFSPERVSSGHIFRDLATYPKLVGGVNAVSTARAAAFYRSVLTAEVWELSSAEAAEFAKLAETTYRDVNIALANEFARFADRRALDVQEVIAAANSQPYSHVHQPGLGVGGHCIPVYPHFLISAGGDDFLLPALARRINDGQVEEAVGALEDGLGDLAGVPVLVLGLTYRAGVAELAYSRAVPLIERLQAGGAEVWAYDPLLAAERVAALGARPWSWETPNGARALVTQTGDPLFATLDFSVLPALEVVFDGRNSLRDVDLPTRVRYFGVGVQAATRRPSRAARAPA